MDNDSVAKFYVIKNKILAIAYKYNIDLEWLSSSNFDSFFSTIRFARSWGMNPDNAVEMLVNYYRIDLSSFEAADIEAVGINVRELISLVPDF